MRHILILALLMSFVFAQNTDKEIKRAIVKIYTSTKEPSFKKPWISNTRHLSGSGSVISNNLILTNAHVVANNTFLEVRRYDIAKRYIAKVVAVSHELDLALVTVKEKSFFKDIKPLPIGKLPQSEQKILVYGYPMGGKTLSVTSGVVSRIEHQSYVHSAKHFLAIQVDAAINPGNSGGAAISNGKIVGVVMQGITSSQNIGYLVPTVMVKQFLKDWSDKRIDGVPTLGVYRSKLENSTARAYYGLKEDQSGILVTKVMPLGNSNGILKEGDIILSIDGTKIENDGSVSFRPGEYTSAKYLTDIHQLGDKIKLKVWRNKKEIALSLSLNKPTAAQWLVKDYQYDKDPTYFIYGGYVFSPLVENLVSSGKRKNCTIHTLMQKFATKKRKGQVILLYVLADRSNRGNQNIHNYLPVKLNGNRIIDFNDFYKRLIDTKGRFVLLKDSENRQLIIDVKKLNQRHKKILQMYNIQYDRSKDLRDINGTNRI